MKQEPLSPAQLQVLIWTGLLAPAAESLPGILLPGAGQNAWSAVLLGGLLALLGGRLLARCGDRPARRLKQGLGPAGGTAVLLVCLVWLQLLLTLRLDLCTRRLLLWGGRDGSRLFFLAVLTCLVLREARSSLTAFARAGQLFFAALGAAGVLILLLSLPAARPERLRPVELPPPDTILRAAGVLGWAFPAVFLPRACEGRPWRLRWDLLGLGLLTLSQGIILANLGPGLASAVDIPFFTLAKSVGVEGAFQRAESAVAALWIFSDLVLAGLLVNAQRQLLGETAGHESVLVPALILLAAAGAWTGLPLLGRLREMVPWGNLLLALLLPVLIRMTEGLRSG